MKHKGALSALKDGEGRIMTKREELADLALTGRAMAFMGYRSPIFESKGEQVLKEVSVRNMSNYEKWAPIIWPECEYEDEICYEASINKVFEGINSIKVDRAAGVDKVLSTMLHSASHGF